MIEKGKCSPYTTTLYEIIRSLGINHKEFGELLDKELPKKYWDNEL